MEYSGIADRRQQFCGIYRYKTLIVVTSAVWVLFAGDDWTFRCRAPLWTLAVSASVIAAVTQRSRRKPANLLEQEILW